ncbi:hypothetical protein ACOSP7_020726 [Xanthoceras sorbifolium]
MWSLLHGKILTNSHRATKGLSIDATYPRCDSACEDLNHLLRGCPVSLQIWKNYYGSNFSLEIELEFEKWFTVNMNNNRSYLDLGPGYLLFILTIWFIWIWRCRVVFDPSFSLPLRPNFTIIRFLKDWLHANAIGKAANSCVTKWLAWEPLDRVWVKLNIDGSRCVESGCISAGGVLRDHNKLW